jgi:hypothetical protein
MLKSNPTPPLDREAKRRLAVIRHVEEVTGNVAMSCRYLVISRQAYYTWYRRYQAEGIEGLRTRPKAPKHIPNATHVEAVGKIIYLRQNDHFGPEKIAMYLIGKVSSNREHPAFDKRDFRPDGEQHTHMIG